MFTIIALSTAGGLILGGLAGYLAGTRRIGTLTTALTAATRNASIDRLTGLPNRDRLTIRLRELNASRSSGVLAIVNLDRFAQVNQFGYRIGDQLLVLIAGRMRYLAGQDGGTVHRLRADEFAVLWPGAAHQAEPLTARLLTDLAEPIEVMTDDRPVRFRITCTVGLTVLAGTGAGDPTSRLLSQANAALQHAKQFQRGGLMRWHPGLPELPRRRG